MKKPIKTIKEVNQRLLALVENLVLLIIAIATVFAIVAEVMVMVRAAQVTLADLLLLFLYLEVLAMVGLYYNTAASTREVRLSLVKI